MPLSDEQELNTRATAYSLAAQGGFHHTPEEVYEFLTAALPDAEVQAVPSPGTESLLREFPPRFTVQEDGNLLRIYDGGMYLTAVSRSPVC